MGGSTAVIGAGQGLLGGGIGLWALLRFVRWAFEFVCKRFDVRAAHLRVREKDLEARFDSRLSHVEAELERYREATMLLVNALAEHDPQNRALRDVAKILRRAIPITGLSPGLSEVGQRAMDALDRAERGEP